MRVVYHKNYDSQLSREMLAMTDIEVVQLDPETAVSKLQKRSHLQAFGQSPERQRPHQQ